MHMHIACSNIMRGHDNMSMKLVANTATKKFDLLDNVSGETISSIANLLEPVEIQQTIDAPGETNLKFKTYENDRVRSFEVDIAVLAAPHNLNEALLVNQYFISYNLLRHLLYYVNDKLQLLQASSVPKFSHKSLGFYEESNGKSVFLFDKTPIIRGTSHYYDKRFKFKSGTPSDYDKFLKDEILPFKEMQLALVLGLSSVTASFLKDYADIQTIVLNMCGASSTGKSTSAQFIASLWASPRISNNGLVKTFNSTDIARLAKIEGINGVPIILDDATTAPGVNRTSLVYQLSQGEPRGRMTNYGKEVKQGNTWSGLCLITSETPLLSEAETRQGLIARVIDTNDITWTQDGPHAVRIKKTIMNCFGHIGPKYVSKFTALNPIDIYNQFDIALDEVTNSIEKVDNLTNRIANKLAVIHLTSKFVVNLLGYKLDTNAILDLLISFDQVDVEERHIAIRAYEVIKDYIQKNSYKFRQTAQGSPIVPHHGELFGVIEYFKDSLIANIPTQRVKDILRNARIYEYKTILKYWGDNDMIIKQSNRHSRNISALDSRVISFTFDNTGESILNWPVTHVNLPKLSSKSEMKVANIELDDQEDIDAIFIDKDDRDED